MKSRSLYETKVKKTQSMLELGQIDAYIIKTKEGSDKTVENIFGFAVVGEAYMVITPRKCYSVASVIDAQDSEECGLFDEVIKYSKEGPRSHVLNLINQVNPERIALNVSKNNPKADGFTVGSYRDFMKMFEGRDYEFVSSELFIDDIY